jgi:hypothetical protein
MYDVLYDRIFWIYVIITVFFIIIGMGLIISSNDLNIISISILWLISILALMINVYHLYIENDNHVKIFVIIIFISLLIIAVIWAGELWNQNNNQLLIILCVLILLGGVILFNLRTKSDNINTVTFWTSLIFISVWIGLTIHIVS